MNIDFDKLIRPNDYCKIKTNKFKKNTGIEKGQLCYVAGSQAVPEKDLYTQRIKFLVHLLDDGGKIVKANLHYMDPKSLERLSEPRRNELHELNGTTDEKVEVVPGHVGPEVKVEEDDSTD